MKMAVSLSFQSSQVYLMEPVIGSEPVYRGRYLKCIHTRPRCVDVNHQSKQTTKFDIDLAEDQKSTVPYRLPRIPPRSSSPVEAVLEENVPNHAETVWGRFGYETAIRIPTLLPSVNKMMMNTPVPVNTQNPQNTSLAIPRFRNAGITPLKLNTHRHKIQDDVLRSLMEKADQSQTARETTRCDPSPTPIFSRSSSIKSVKSIHWTLGDNVCTSSPLFDKKGRSRVQGPFSREFTVTCFAPHNWLRLKLGRSKSMMR